MRSIMAEEAGARLTDGTIFYGHLLAGESLTHPGLWPHPTMDTLAGGAILVDRSGRRFIDRGAWRHRPLQRDCAARLIRSPSQRSSIMPFGSGQGRAELVPPNPQLVAAGGTLVSAPDLATLAQKIGVPPQALQQTTETYNKAVSADRGSAARAAAHVRANVRGVAQRRQARKRRADCRTAPYYAVPLAVGISYTMGGIEIDAQARVIGRNGEPISGLFAAGSCTGGVEGGPLGGYIGGYLKAVGLGLIAGPSRSEK